MTNKLSKTTCILFKDFRYFNAGSNDLKLECILENVILKALGGVYVIVIANLVLTEMFFLCLETKTIVIQNSHYAEYI